MGWLRRASLRRSLYSSCDLHKSKPVTECFTEAGARHSALGLFLAVARGPARHLPLLGALDSQRARLNIARDDASRADERTVADLDRRNQRAVGADEGALADLGAVLGEAVIVAGDRAGADIGLLADAGVT